MFLCKLFHLKIMTKKNRKNPPNFYCICFTANANHCAQHFTIMRVPDYPLRLCSLFLIKSWTRSKFIVCKHLGYFPILSCWTQTYCAAEWVSASCFILLKKCSVIFKSVCLLLFLCSSSPPSSTSSSDSCSSTH